MMVIPLLAGLLCGLAPGPRAVALLPISVGTDRPGVRDGAQLLSAMLATRLEREGHLKVITSEELHEMLAVETDRQQLGCNDDGCLAELAGLMGAEELITGRIVTEGETLAWTTGIVNQRTAETVRTGTVRGATISELGAQVEELVLQLLGRAADAALEGEAARVRLGFEDAADLARFRAFRAAHPALSTSEALTRFIVDHNVESTRLAVAQVAVFGAAAGAVVLLALVSVGNLVAYTALNPYLLLVGSVAAFLLIPAALALGLAGVGLAVVDALNLGHVTVREDGCCRDDAAIREASAAAGARDAAALAVILSGPATIAGVMAAFIVYGAAISVLLVASQRVPALRIDPEATFPTVVVLPALLLWTLTFWAGLPLVVTPLVCSSPVGLLLLLWPGKSAITPGKPPPPVAAPAPGPDADDADDDQGEDA